MRTLLISFIFVICCAASSFAQRCIPLHESDYGASGIDEGLDIIYTLDRGSIVAGRTTSASHGGFDAFLMKLTETGVVEWSKNYGGDADDEFIRVVQTADGGFVAIGTTNSFGSSDGEPFVLRTDAAGNLLWSRSYLPDNTGKHRATSITTLGDGGLAITINLNDGTINSNALILRLDASGNLKWSRSFDNGKADGFSDITERSDTLIVGGFSEMGPFNESNGIVAELNSTTGQLFQTFSIRKLMSFQGPPVWNSKVVMVKGIPGGIAFTTQRSLSSNDLADTKSITHFKRMSNGSMVYERNIWYSTMFGAKMGDIRAAYLEDGGFIMLQTDSTTVSPFSYFSYIGPLGLQEQGRRFADFSNYKRVRMRGLVPAGNDGFLAVGGFRQNVATRPLKVRVKKMDKTGAVGDCTNEVALNFVDTIQHSIVDYTWAESRLYSETQTSSVTLNSSDNGFALIDQCSAEYCYEASTIPDNCSSTFLVNLKSDDGHLSTIDMIPAIEGGFIGGGVLRKTSSIEPVIVKLKPSGDVEWTYSLSKYITEGIVYKVLPTKDGNYLAMVTGYMLVGNGVNRYALIVKLSPRGEFLWSRKFNVSGSFTFNDIISADDGGFFAIATSGYGSPPTRNYLIRLRSDGTVAWKKQSYSPNGDPGYKSILLDGKDLYISGDYRLNSYRFRVEKRDANTGDLIWHERVNLPYANGIFIKNMLVLKDTLYVVMTTYTKASVITPDIRTMVVKITTGGKLADGYMVSSLAENGMAMSDYVYQSDPKPVDVLITHDRQIVISQQVKSAVGEGLAITKFSPDGRGAFSILYPDLVDHYVHRVEQNGDNILVTGRIFKFPAPTESRIYSSFVMNVDSIGRVSDSTVGGCTHVKLPFTITPLDEVLTEWKDLDSVGIANYLIDSPEDYKTRPVSAKAKLICSVSSTCSSIEISGKDSICDLAGVYRYTATKNAGCATPVVWIVDTTMARIINYTDSTVDLKFLKGGYISLNARLSVGCKSLGDKMEIYVSSPIAYLNLGPDTSVCAGTKLVLRPGPGYASYLWQDGSTDSVFSVRGAGNYSVRVTDFCGREVTDTIAVYTTAVIYFDGGPDRQICLGDTAQLNAPEGYSNYSWKNTASTQIQTQRSINVNPLQSTLYVLTAEKSPGCLALDSINVTVVQAKAVNLGNDTSICGNKSFTLDAGGGYKGYQWNNGAQSQSIPALTTGIYFIAAVDYNGCTARDTFWLKQVYPAPSVALFDLSSICEGTSFVYNAPTGMRSYTWSDGSTGSVMSVKQPGVYWVEVVDANGCEASDTTEIKSVIPKLKNFLPDDLGICSYEVLTIRPKRDFVRYIWSTGESTKDIQVKATGTYWLAVTDSYGCISSDTLLITKKDCPKGFFVPNIFTPNNDGKNDRFKPVIFGNLTKYEFQIFNHFGEVVFKSNDPSAGWDGNIQGKMPSIQTFAWRCVYKYDGEPIQQAKGTVTIVR